MEWFEDEDFWRDLYPAMFSPDRFAVADQQVSQILELARIEGRSVLDLCCGPGRHSVSFAQRGFKVTGVDLSEFLLARARDRAAEFGVAVEWIKDDMRQFNRPQAFDLACSLFTSFGYFQDEQDDLKVLRNVRSSLVSGGVLVIETLGKERLARVWQNAQCQKLPDGTLVLQRPEVCADWTRVRNEWVVIKDGRSKSFHFEHTIYSGRELKERLIQAGFGQVSLYGDLEGNPYGVEAMRLVAIAHNT